MKHTYDTFKLIVVRCEFKWARGAGLQAWCLLLHADASLSPSEFEWAVLIRPWTGHWVELIGRWVQAGGYLTCWDRSLGQIHRTMGSSGRVTHVLGRVSDAHEAGVAVQRLQQNPVCSCPS